jgi:hypothetical protein
MLIEKLLCTSLLFTALFYLAILWHGDDEPTFCVKAIEAVGFLLSLGASFVFAFIEIWN